MGPRTAYAVSAIGCVCVYILTVVLQFLSSFCPVDNGVFRSPTRSIWRKYWSGIHASDITEYLTWCIIHVFQVVWLVYSVALGRRKVFIDASQRGDPFFMPIKMFWIFSLALVFYMVSFFTWDREQLWLAMIFVTLAQVHLVLALVASIQAIKDCKLRLVHFGNRKEILYVILLVQNGIGVFATWLAFSTTFHFGVVVVHSIRGGFKLASGLSLSILATQMLLFIIIDLFLVWRHTLYLISPYLTMMTGFAGIVAEAEEHKIYGFAYNFSATLLALAVIFNFLKIFHTSYRVIWKGYSYDHCVADVDIYPNPMRCYVASPEVDYPELPRDIDAPLTEAVRNMQRNRVMIHLNPMTRSFSMGDLHSS